MRESYPPLPKPLPPQPKPPPAPRTVKTSRNYDGTVARIAGNLLSGSHVVQLSPEEALSAATRAVMVARAIVAETIRTEPKDEP